MYVVALHALAIPSVLAPCFSFLGYLPEMSMLCGAAFVVSGILTAVPRPIEILLL